MNCGLVDESMVYDHNFLQTIYWKHVLSELYQWKKIIPLQTHLKCDTLMTIAERHDGDHTLTSVAVLSVSNVATALIWTRCIHTILVTSTITGGTFIVIYV